MNRSAAALSRLTVSMDDAAKRLADLERLPDSVVRAIAIRAVKDLEPVARQMLLANYDQTGLGDTGRLRSVIARTVIEARISGRTVSIAARLPAGVSPYESTGSKSDFYTVAASLNFGAVIMKRAARQIMDLPTGKTKTGVRAPIGAKAKRTLKKIALGGDVSERARESIEQGRTARGLNSGAQIVGGYGVGVKKSESKTAVKMTGGATVIKPRPFYRFTAAQQAELGALFSESFVREFFAAAGWAA